MSQDRLPAPIRLILQGPEGFGNGSLLEALKRLLSVPDPKRVIFSVAYLTKSGIKLIEDDLKRLAGRVRVFAGIRNKITSRQGLALLLDFGAELFVVDTGGCPPQVEVTYHPKLYLAISTTKTHLVVGSANLTMGGLKNNIEASIEVTLDPTDPDALRFQQATEEQFDALPDRFPDNVIAITSQADLKCLTGRLADEEQKVPDPNHRPDDGVPRMKPRLAPKPSPPGDGWIKLSECNSRPRTACPSAIRFWDGSKQPLGQWNLLLYRVVEKLYAEGRLTAKDLPIARILDSGQESQKRYLVRVQPVHPTGRDFFHAKEIKLEDGSFFVEGGMRAKSARQDAKKVLDRYGQDPSTIYLKTGPPSAA